MASLYQTFPAAEARRIAKRLEFHHTPKHGSWLNMAEIEFSVLARACLRGRNGDEDSPERAVRACVSERNAIGATGGSLPKTPDELHRQELGIQDLRCWPLSLAVSLGARDDGVYAMCPYICVGQQGGYLRRLLPQLWARWPLRMTVCWPYFAETQDLQVYLPMSYR